MSIGVLRAAVGVLLLAAPLSCERSATDNLGGRSADSLAEAGTAYNVQLCLAKSEPANGYRGAKTEMTGERVFVASKPSFTGSDIAEVEVDARDDVHPALVIRLTDEAQKRFAAFTRENTKARLAIVVGERVLLAPVIEQPIEDGLVQLTGAFTREQLAEIKQSIESPRAKVP
jgi:preprotein translocase subunit SecD